MIKLRWSHLKSQLRHKKWSTFSTDLFKLSCSRQSSDERCASQTTTDGRTCSCHMSIAVSPYTADIYTCLIHVYYTCWCFSLSNIFIECDVFSVSDWPRIRKENVQGKAESSVPHKIGDGDVQWGVCLTVLRPICTIRDRCMLLCHWV